MVFEKVMINPSVSKFHRQLDAMFNDGVRNLDLLKSRIGLKGRKANYDDIKYEFVGGDGDYLRKKHYDKSLKLLWKAEQHAPWLSFKDASREEKLLMEMADQSMTRKEKIARQQMNSQEFKDKLNREYTTREKEAIVKILSAIGHGEAYAWLVSAELLQEVQSTGARAALTMQVLEEAKHFVVLRELVQAFDVEIPKLSSWEYLMLERVHKAQGLDKFFGMNVLIESIALGIFGMFSTFPGLEILRFFHLDEARHTGLPANYFDVFPLSDKQKNKFSGKIQRLNLLLPVIPFVFYMEEDLAELGIDVFEFGGSVARKVLHLSNKIGFELALPNSTVTNMFNELFNSYCFLTRKGHVHTQFLDSETTLGEKELIVEQEVFGNNVVNRAA
ncbi:MAG: hypothetical protein HQM12_17535 [SAR324 cluster bacterium]|nr:hypothetical protein [SAR324 cluster bacterium]